MVRINRLTAEEWLRLLREHAISNWPVHYCVACEEAENSTSVLKCERCHAPMMALDESFWQKISNKLRRSYQKDHGLFARVKGEHPNRPFPQLQGPLEWVSEEWRRTRKPRGRPPEIEKRLFVASWVRKLSQPYFSIEVGDALDMSTQDVKDEEPIVCITKLSADNSGVVVSPDIPADHMRIVEHPPYMSLTLALSVLFDEEAEFSTPGSRELPRKHTKFSEKELRDLGKQFREEFNQHFRDVPAQNRREVERAIRWLHRQAQDPTYRIAGIKPRDRGAKHKAGVDGQPFKVTDRAKEPS